MDDFHYRDGRLQCEQADLEELADRHGTPLYVYSRQTLEDHYRTFRQKFSALDPLLCFSAKSLGNVELLRVLVELGAGIDIVSGGELFRALQAEAPAEKIVFAGVGKTDREIREALAADVGWLNIESGVEFENVAGLARSMGKTVDAALRVNPDVWDSRTPSGTTTGRRGTKFGVDIEHAKSFFDAHGDDDRVRLRGIHIHLGSPIMAPAAYGTAIDRVLDLVGELGAAGYEIDTLNVGGGIPADYGGESEVEWDAYAAAIVTALKPFVDRGGRVIMEPGRALSANAGVLLARVLYVKVGGDRKFVVVDAGMNALLRPAMYGAFHFAWPVSVEAGMDPPSRSRRIDLPGLERVDVVGPICESTDWLARGHDLPPLSRGDLLCIFGAGAYGMVMASQYNAQPRPAEILVEGRSTRVVRRREAYRDLVELKLAPEVLL